MKRIYKQVILAVSMLAIAFGMPHLCPKSLYPRLENHIQIYGIEQPLPSQKEASVEEFSPTQAEELLRAIHEHAIQPPLKEQKNNSSYGENLKAFFSQVTDLTTGYFEQTEPALDCAMQLIAGARPTNNPNNSWRDSVSFALQSFSPIRPVTSIACSFGNFFKPTLGTMHVTLPYLGNASIATPGLGTALVASAGTAALVYALSNKERRSRLLNGIKKIFHPANIGSEIASTYVVGSAFSDPESPVAGAKYLANYAIQSGYGSPTSWDLAQKVAAAATLALSAAKYPALLAQETLTKCIGKGISRGVLWMLPTKQAAAEIASATQMQNETNANGPASAAEHA